EGPANYIFLILTADPRSPFSGNVLEEDVISVGCLIKKVVAKHCPIYPYCGGVKNRAQPARREIRTKDRLRRDRSRTIPYRLGLFRKPRRGETRARSCY